MTGQILNISKDNNILLVIPEYVNQDIASACLALNLFAKKQNATLQIFGEHKHNLNHFLGNKNSIKISRQIVGNKYQISLPKNNGIKDVELTENESEYNLEITTYNGNLDTSKYEIKQNTAKVHNLIFLGVNSTKDFEEEFKKDIEIVQTSYINYIGGKPDFEVDSQNIKKSSSFSELLFEQLLNENHTIDDEIATILLTGIISNTSNLTINTHSKTFENSNKLVNNHQADWKKAQDLAKTKITDDQAFWFSEVFANAKKNKSLSYAIIKHEKVTSNLLSKLSFEDKLPLLKFNDTEHSVVIINLNNKTHGFAGSKNTNVNGGSSYHNNNISALDITDNFERIGGRNFVHFWTDKPIDETLKVIHKKLNLEFKDNPEPQSIEKPTEKASSNFELSERAKKLLEKNNGNKQKTINEITKPKNNEEKENKTDLENEENYSDDTPKQKNTEEKSIKPKTSFFDRFKKKRVEETKKEEKNSEQDIEGKKKEREINPSNKSKNQATVLKAKDLSFVPTDYDPLPSAGE